MKIGVYYIIKKMGYIRCRIIYLQKINRDGLLDSKIRSYYRIYEILSKKRALILREEMARID